MKLIEMNRKAMLAASSKYSSNSLPLVINILLLTSVIFYQAFTDVKSRENRNLLFLAPIAWIVFYFMDFVEYQALIRSFWRLFRKKQVMWQKWQRLGAREGLLAH